MKHIVLLLFSLGLLSAGNPYYSVKSEYRGKDMDGVVDRDDRCPHTPFFALVNKNGCAVKRLKLSKKQKREIQRLLFSRR